MAEFSYFSDTDDSAVEELISQTQELCVLEQVSAINCSGFIDSVLPTELESRFSKLKSFPLTKSKPNSNLRSKTELNNSVKGNKEFDEENENFSQSKQNLNEELGLKPKSRSGSFNSLNLPTGSEIFSPSKENRNEKKGLESKSKHGYVSSPSGSSNSSIEGEIFSASKQKSGGKKRSKPISSPPGSSNSLMDSPSPPRKTGCFWCSPKGASKKKSKENREGGTNLDWDKNDEFLSDLAIFSAKEQQKILKKAMKEEQKISDEAEKIIKWAKHASGRINVSDIEEVLSDSESRK